MHTQASFSLVMHTKAEGRKKEGCGGFDVKVWRKNKKEKVNTKKDRWENKREKANDTRVKYSNFTDPSQDRNH